MSLSNDERRENDPILAEFQERRDKILSAKMKAPITLPPGKTWEDLSITITDDEMEELERIRREEREYIQTKYPE